ncbi:PNK3P-domain-containing protein [Dothidotthia symphoricarpi CBS 119687]|uniref:PNK3P-domain-containing protein n=1 Tax=Dothidotthia symphoricarpi CBS 119687 TaxID=1392245 RepID=A0A6A6A5Q8_9PLEO|nr:PNK3P-domain-containing protein [Dothidotthia symphoricarpi CBS 119687]KAF2127312.1 PNK3P-domain-containing protein [Dothidotthia symphoricarpi CBS 119687]
MSERPSLTKRRSSNDRGVSPPPTKRRQQSATTSKAVANFFTPVSKKEPEKMTWRIVKDSLLVGRYGASSATTGKRRIAAFDFDSTLVTPASGKKFGKDATDWKWWHGSVPGRLKKLHEEGYVIAIVSNQGGISLKSDPKTVKSDQKRLADFKSKLSAVLTQLDLPISVYAATGRDQYRKPRVGMWQELMDDCDCDSADAVDLETSFFVGDAGGREAVPGGAVKDHSCVDRDFAANVGLSFHTPEEFFLHEEPRPFVRAFDPTQYIKDATDNSTSLRVSQFTKSNPLDIVLLCGSPGAGKSSFYWKHLQPQGYARVNQDILKTREKCIKVASALVKEEATSVVVDNTNADPDTRAVWVQVAQKLSVPIRCVLFTAPAKLCEHNDAVRAMNLGSRTNPESRSLLPKLAFTSFASRYREPKVDEGFQDVTNVDFELEGDDELKKLWGRYWM